MGADERRKAIYQAIGRLYSRIPGLARAWGRRYSRLVRPQTAESTPFVPLRRPLRQCRIALVTTGGVHLRSQPPFDMRDPRGDPTFRAIPSGTPPADLTITHDYYDHTDAERDLNILFPLALFRELAESGRIGALATCYGFMGHIEPPHVETLVRATAPQVAGMLAAERVDAALLTPA
jgi:D-proline reductase (dithiol) PrdB